MKIAAESICSGVKPASPHAIFVLTSSLAPKRMLAGQCRRLVEEGYRVTLVCSPGPEAAEFARREGIEAVAIEMAREISPFRDCAALLRLVLLFRRLRPDLVEAGTPKAGLLGMAAAWLSGVPCRLYALHGLRLETARGLRRAALLAAERTACRLASRVTAVSPSLRARAVELGVAPEEKFVLLADGSANGVDARRFASPRRPRRGRAPVVGFVGRLTRDKGIAELYEAFGGLRGEFPDLRLMLVGEFESGDPLGAELRRLIDCDPAVIRTGFVDDLAALYREMDVLALPSYREGLPTVALEAAAAELPVVAFRATGTVDAIADGETGVLTPPGDVGALREALAALLREPERAGRMGRAGRERVLRLFAPERIRRARLRLYARMRNEAPPRRSRLALAIKRLLDFSVAAVLLVATAPLLAAVAAAIRFSMGPPATFRQLRGGFRSRRFTLWKFRTMSEQRDARGRLLADRLRITPLGRALRRTSLDELPQLWNVLRGEMSLVGPRPLLAKYLPLYDERQMRRHLAQPGVTGWAQIHGRNALEWDERFRLDLFYVENWSLLLDLKILSETVRVVLRKRGVTDPDGGSPEAFSGSAPACRPGVART